MKFIFSPPAFDDLINLLKSWRFWILGAIVGALVGAIFYYIAPPPYRAIATVNVDFNLEEAFPTETDRQYFYYLERESRKMVEIAWSDEVMSELLFFLSEKLYFSLSELRSEKLHLAQPMEAGWHFYADDENPKTAEMLATLWANAFVRNVHAEIEAGNINPFVRLETTQSTGLPIERSIPLSSYLLSGACIFLLLVVFVMLFLKPDLGRR